MNEYINRLNEKLRAEYPHKIELHAHTSPVSSCSEIAPARLVEMYAELGFSAVCITNHLSRGRSDDAEYFLADFYAAKEAGSKLGVNVILGAELRFAPNTNDYLAYGITPDELSEINSMLDMSFEEFSIAWRKPDRVLLQAHPYRNDIVQMSHDLLDGIEVFNCHPNHNSRVAVAARVANAEENFITVAGTDFHHPTHQGLGAVRARFAPETSADIVKLLRSGDYLFEVGGSIVIP